MSLLCRYTNTTASVQIARITDLPSGYFERVVFPGVCLLFEAPAGTHLEIHTATMVSAIMSDRIPCDRLAVLEEHCLAFRQESDLTVPAEHQLAVQIVELFYPQYIFRRI
ncbi:MAG TPA: DUF1830 domain-containing protein [Stenomitos sp.]